MYIYKCYLSQKKGENSAVFLYILRRETLSGSQVSSFNEHHWSIFGRNVSDV